MSSTDDSREGSPAPIEVRAQHAIEQIMAGGDLSEITLTLSNSYTDEKVEGFKRALKRRPGAKPDSTDR